MSFLNKKSFLLVGLLILALVVLPVTVYFFQNSQDNRTRADKTVVLSYEPTSNSSAPMQIPAGGTFSLDVYVDPGPSAVSFVKAEMMYDASKFELAGGFIANQEVFSQVIDGPTNTPGKLVTTLSIGSDTSKALKQKTKVGTLTLKVLNNVPANATSNVTFGGGSQALAISSNASFDENVIANTVPATIKFNTPTLTCGTSPTDAMLVIDKSGSMSEQAGSSGTKMTNAKSSASNFIDILAKETRNTVGLSTYATSGTLDSGLTNDFNNVKNKVNAISANGGTCIECGIVKANQEITNKKRAGIKNVVILLTDGLANHVEGNTREVDTTTAENRALAAAKSGHQTNGTIFFTIGLGKNVNSTFLTKVAESTGGQYYFSPTTDQLNSIYTQISQILAKGSASGVVFNDANSNGVIDDGEPNIPGWVLQLQPTAGHAQTITTDSTGSYSFPNLCDGSYTITQVKPSTWKQTFPAGNANHAFTITNGNAATDKNFGNNKGSRCSDGIDNDGNGFADSKDSTCHTDGDPNNPDSYDPAKNGENGGNTCSDSKDNNGNGKVDGADPVCHEDGDPQKPWDPNLPEGNNGDGRLVCSPNTIALTDGGKELSVVLQNAGGQPLANKTITWTSSNPSAVISPLTSQTDSTGKAVTSVLVPLSVDTAFTGSISAKFAGDASSPTASCVITSTYTPGLTPVTLDLNLLIHGIGNSGDNANPTANSLSNKDPLTKERKAVVSLFDVNNNIVASGEAQVVYSSASGSFTGTVTTSTPVAPGKYSVKVRTDYHLTRLLPGIQTIVAKQTNTMPPADYVAGDATNDNRLDIRDYNQLLDCYSDLSAPIACNPEKKVTTDANDDGDVNQFDYNLFLREISTQPGE